MLSTKLVEHVVSPQADVLIYSTPYHGYLKSRALALSGKLDAHFTVLWDGGHIKFWSRRILTALLQEAGFLVVPSAVPVAGPGCGSRCCWLAASPFRESFRLQLLHQPLRSGARLAVPAPAARLAQSAGGSERG